MNNYDLHEYSGQTAEMPENLTESYTDGISRKTGYTKLLPVPDLNRSERTA